MNNLFETLEFPFKGDFETFKRTLTDGSRASLQRHGVLHHTFFFVVNGTMTATIPHNELYESPDAKDLIAKVVKEILETMEPTYSGMVSDTWVVESNHGESMGVPPSEHPDRKSCVFIRCVDHTTSTVDIRRIRYDEDPLVLGEVEEVNGVEDEGRFAL